jgi:hypothetical protein
MKVIIINEESLSQIIKPSFKWSFLANSAEELHVYVDINKAFRAPWMNSFDGFSAQLPIRELFDRQTVVIYARPKRIGVNLITSQRKGIFPYEDLFYSSLIDMLSCMARSFLPSEPPRLPLSSVFHLTYLSLSGTSVTDSSLTSILPLFPHINCLDLTRCDNLIYEPLNYIVSNAESVQDHLTQIFLDGCWNLEANAYISMLPISMHVGILHDAPLNRHDVMEVVILGNSRHRGSWVRCSIIDAVSPGDGTTNTERPFSHKYNIFVWETIKYDHAIGFSGSPAMSIDRVHLRNENKKAVPRQTCS